jgi:hypothetical protein
MQNNYNSRCGPSGCPKSGIKIHDWGNDPKTTNKNTTNKNTTNTNTLDLDINNYELTDLYKLFSIHDLTLTEEIMKNAKKKVLMSHPDKSQLDPKVFLFYSSAYKRLYSIYEFQNKASSNKKLDSTDYHEQEKQVIVNKLFDEKKGKFKKGSEFSSWFNEQFEKNRVENSLEKGYGDWLKTDDGIYEVGGNVTKTNMNDMFEQQKKQIQALSVYNGVGNIFFSPGFGSSLLENDSNFGSGNLFNDGGLGYTDLRQAHVETVIPVTMEDYNNTPKFKNVNEYKTHRDNVNVAPISETESTRILYNQNKKIEEESAALAYHYARQTEKAKDANNNFWSSLLKLTN